MFNKFLYVALIFTCLSLTGQAENELIKNGGIENGEEGWIPLWTRENATGKAVIDKKAKHNGAQSIRIEHTGSKDWSLGQQEQINVQPGDIYELSAWVQLQGNGNTTLGVISRDKNGKVHDWCYGGKSVRQTKGWQQLHTRFIIPKGVATIQARLIGEGPATVRLDDVTLTKQDNMNPLLSKKLPDALSISNDSIDITFHTGNAVFDIKDRRNKKIWSQQTEGSQLIVLDAAVGQNKLDIKLIDQVSMLKMSATVNLNGNLPEFSITLKADGGMESNIFWPATFASAKGQLLILPVNEGISYPVDDKSIPPMHYHLYGGHGLCMPWYGSTDGQTGWMAIVETADDAAVRITRQDELLCLIPEWQPQKGQFGADRVIRYVILDRGGYVAMAKRYRKYAKEKGLLKNLTEKRKTIPAVDKLVGAVNVWCWDKDAPSICREMQALGIERILWSNKLPPDELKSLNAMNVLTSRYDIFQDTMNPENFSKLRYRHPDWTSDAWAKDDLMIGKDGEWVRGWEIETKDGKGMIPCGTLCDRQAVPYAKKRIPPELKTHPYRCRFIDTTTASPWRECYHPKHPMTRTESKKYKMDLLRYISEGCGLVCGSETGHDAAVPFVHYFEGMLSLGPYRVPDSGRKMMEIWDNIPEKVAKFQTGHIYRIPLWELVYHDCVIAQWYWGDYNNKLPKLWDRRDLWNTLYGTPPMFMFNKESWEKNKNRFIKSYKTIAPVARATGYSEMLSHEWLTSDHAVQQTRFADGTVVTANFGATSFTLPDGTVVPPLGYHTLSY